MPIKNFCESLKRFPDPDLILTTSAKTAIRITVS
jgi:hypothetical protein